MLVLHECFVDMHFLVSGLLVFQAQQYLGREPDCHHPRHGPSFESLLDCIVTQHVWTAVFVSCLCCQMHTLSKYLLCSMLHVTSVVYAFLSFHSWDSTTSGFWRQTAAMLKFYFWFPRWPFHCHQHVVLCWRTKFHQNRIFCSKVTS